MKCGWSGNALAALVIGGVVGAASAAPMDVLQGAWGMSGTDCNAIFERVGGKIQFRDPGSSLNTGVIISGNKVIASTASCTIAKVREVKDHFSVLLNCSSAIMIGDATMAFRLIDDTHTSASIRIFRSFRWSLPNVRCEWRGRAARVTVRRAKATCVQVGSPRRSLCLRIGLSEIRNALFGPMRWIRPAV